MHMWWLGGRGGCLYSLLLAWHAKACTYAACQPSAVSVAGGHVICPCCVYVAARPGGSGMWIHWEGEWRALQVKGEWWCSGHQLP